MDKSNTKMLRQVYSGSHTANISGDYIIPDVVSDIESILALSTDVKVENTILRENEVEITGTITYEVLILGEDGTLSGITYSEDIDSIAQVNGVNDGCIALVGQGQTTTDHKLINPRKIGINTEISLPLTVYCPVDVSTTVSGTQCLDDEISIQRRQKSYCSLSVKEVSEGDIPVSYDLLLDGNNPPISKILYRRLRLTPYEIKARGNEIEAKTYANVYIVYLSEEGNRFSADKSFILEKAVTFEGAESFEWSSRVSSKNLNTEISENNYGEKKLVELDFDYDLNLNGVKNVEVSVCDDIYSTECECKSKSQEICVTSLKREYRSSLSVNASTSREEIGATDIKSVLGATVELTNITNKFVPEKNKLICEATAQINMVCENTSLAEDDNKYTSYKYKYPFKCEIDCSQTSEDSVFSCILSVMDVRYRADSTKLYCDFETTFRIMNIENQIINVVKEAELNKDEKINRPKFNMTLCYPSGRESLWDIAKYYKITPQSITQSNSLDSDEIENKKVLLIPTYHKKKPLVSKVI